MSVQLRHRAHLAPHRGGDRQPPEVRAGAAAVRQVGRRGGRAHPHRAGLAGVGVEHAPLSQAAGSPGEPPIRVIATPSAVMDYASARPALPGTQAHQGLKVNVIWNEAI